MHLRLGQNLSMTPQLQQAIRLLQLSSVELQEEIQLILDSNVMLELDESIGETHEESANDLPPANTAETDERDEWETEVLTATNEQVESNDIPEEMPVDTEWDDIYQTTATTGLAETDEENMLETRNAAIESLQDHLAWQLNLTPMSARDRQIALAIIDAVGASGLLNQTVDELFQGLADQWRQQNLYATDHLERDEVIAVLHRIQQFDPPGVAAQNLRECLLIQLKQLDPDTPWLIDAVDIVSNHLELLGDHDYKTLIRKSGIRENTLREAIKLIQQLNPHPGDAIDTERTEYIVPDVIVYKKSKQWHIELNPETAPRLRINKQYASLVKRADNSRDNTIMKDHLQEARWFLKSLESRHETLLKVASAIVERQRPFLEYGAEAMKPMILSDIAAEVGLHESTVSRITTNKFIHTPQGVFELKFFFSSHVATADGGECSSTAIRALIRKMVDGEDSVQPLSDSDMVKALESQGIHVARRTIAKYREALGIPPSHERKSLG